MENNAKKRNGFPEKQDENFRPNAVPAPLKVIQGALSSSEAASAIEPTAIERFVPAILYDGGTVETTIDDHDDAIAWCRTYMGWNIAQQENWKPGPKAVVGRMTHMGWGIWIESGADAEGNPVPAAKREVVDPNIRWCWSTKNLRQKHNELKQAGVRVTELYADPQGRDSFDFWAMSGRMRLTAIEDPGLKDDSFADANIFRVMVKDLKHSIEWYRQYIGMELQSDHSDEGYAVITLGINYHPDGRSIWVLEENPAMPETGPIDGLFRTRCFIESRESCFAYHQHLKDSGANVSKMGGYTVKGRIYFHVYDLDGNRFDVSSF